MTSVRNGERLWALRLIARHGCHRASLRIGAALLPLLPASAQVSIAEAAFALFGLLLPSVRQRRAARTLEQLGHAPSLAHALATRFRARHWLHIARARQLQSLPFPALQCVLRGMTWLDPAALWTASAGRQRVICLLPSGDINLAVGALLDRPGAPAHYFINSMHHDNSPIHRTLLALQRQGHRLDIGRAPRSGEAWRMLRRGAAVVTVLDPYPWCRPGETAEPAPLRLARLARAPVLLLGHRCDGSAVGTLHVLGEYSAECIAGGATALYTAAHAFLAAAPHDWRDLDR